MAVTPLCNKTVDALYEKLRLSLDKTTETSQRYIDRAIQHVRIEMYKAIGVTELNTILETASVENPITETAVRRLTADILEAIWVEYVLICTMPLMLFDAASSSPPEQVYNLEPLTRDIDSETLEIRKNELLRWKNDMLGELTDESVLNILCIGRQVNGKDVPAISGSSTIYQPALIARWYPYEQWSTVCGDGEYLNCFNECVPCVSN